jgi:hypothetical protein
MGHKGSKSNQAAQGVEVRPDHFLDRRLSPIPSSTSSANVPLPEPEQPKYPFRCEDRAKIPDAIVDGPFEDFEIATDVYSTAYLIARNSGDMYSIWPWKNRDMLIVWMYLLFIAVSQLFVILSVTFWYPPTVGSDTMLVVCSNKTAVRDAFRQGFISSANESFCLEEGKFSFAADVRGNLSHFYTLEKSTRYFDSIMKEGDASIYVLRLICCIWVFSQVYLQEFCNVQSLLLYHDFSCWFLPLKGEPIRNAWAICLPLIQYSVVLVVCTVSFVIICAQAEAFDIVMNSLAFTFISEVGSFFNGPLAKRMGSCLIKDLPPDDYPDPVFYLYPEYDISNAVYDDGKYTDGGWYIVEDEQKAGMLSDYKIRHNPEKYEKFHAEKLGRWLEIALFTVPVLVVILGAIRCHYFLVSVEGETRVEL